jgi:hypothetical protein
MLSSFESVSTWLGQMARFTTSPAVSDIAVSRAELNRLTLTGGSAATRVGSATDSNLNAGLISGC